jgi:hypothetical protein
VVGGLLDLEGAVGVALDDDDAFDLQGAPVLDLLEELIRLPGGVGVGEVGDEQRVGAVGDCFGGGDLLLGRPTRS